MADRKQISALLRAEEGEFIDYPTIEARTRQLGFPTTVRTLRFYVGEGILPAPHKQGKTPVFRERQILNLLLAIHLMKTRFARSLGEIGRVLSRLREDPEVLADKCSILYEESQHGNRLRRVEREWLVDAFFRTLSGQLALYPRRRRGEPGPRQPGEVLLTELTDDLEHVARWEPGPDGEPAWRSPEDVLLGEAAKEGVLMSRPGSESRSEPEVTPLDPPEGAVTVTSAHRREELFLQRFERNLQLVDKVYQPLEKKSYSIKASSLDPDIDDPYQNVVEVLKAHGIYDRELLERLPHNRSTRYSVPPPGLFGRKKPKIVIAGVVRSPIADLARLGGVLEPMGRAELMEVTREQVRDAGAYHVLGILSTVGWSEEVWEHVPRGEDYGIVLVAEREGGGWRLSHSLPPQLEGLLSVFDPENLDEKVSRAFYRIIESAELAIPGGLLEIRMLLEELAISREVLQKAIEQVEQENPRIKLLQIDSREILKRDRY